MVMHYFAYGSNLHPLRLKQRVPSATLIGVVERTHHTLAFHKKGKDGSSKCNMLNTGDEYHRVYGAIYSLMPEHKNDLDRFEGPGYTAATVQLVHEGKHYNCFTYIAEPSHIAYELNPYHWYKQLVVLGAKYLKFPENYIASIESIVSIEDPDAERRQQNTMLLESMMQYD